MFWKEKRGPENTGPRYLLVGHDGDNFPDWRVAVLRKATDRLRASPQYREGWDFVIVETFQVGEVYESRNFILKFPFDVPEHGPK